VATGGPRKVFASILTGVTLCHEHEHGVELSFLARNICLSDCRLADDPVSCRCFAAIAPAGCWHNACCRWLHATPLVASAGCRASTRSREADLDARLALSIGWQKVRVDVLARVRAFAARQFFEAISLSLDDARGHRSS
jgi:hypothetical protein